MLCSGGWQYQFRYREKGKMGAGKSSWSTNIKIGELFLNIQMTANITLHTPVYYDQTNNEIKTGRH